MEVSRGKKKPNGKACPLRVFLGDSLGLCRANVGPFWVYAGPMLGHLMGFWGSMEASGGNKNIPNENFSFGKYVGGT